MTTDKAMVTDAITIIVCRAINGEYDEYEAANRIASLTLERGEAEPVAVKPLEWKHDGHSSYAYCGVTDTRWTAANPEERSKAEDVRATRILSALSTAPQARPTTLDVLRDYFKAMEAGDVPDMALALYSYLLMDGFIPKDAARSEVRTTLSKRGEAEETPAPVQHLRGDHLEELRLAAVAIRTYMPDTLPAGEDGKIHFARALAEAGADAIEHVLATVEGQL